VVVLESVEAVYGLRDPIIHEFRRETRVRLRHAVCRQAAVL
jgi:hypothetical protein